MVTHEEPPRRQPDSPEAIVQDFIYVANTVYGAYLDATMAVGNLAAGYMGVHREHLERVKASGEPLTPQLINPVMFYSVGPEGQQRAVHQTTLVDIIERNALGGRHMQFLARMCIVALYQYWEDDFRPRLAGALGHQVEHDTFGELRHLRRSIIHRGAQAVPELASCKVLPKFAADTEIVLDQPTIDQIITAVKQAATEILGGAA